MTLIDQWEELRRIMARLAACELLTPSLKAELMAIQDTIAARIDAVERRR